MNTFHQMWGVTTPDEAKAKIEEQKIEIGGKEPENLEEQAIALVGKDIYNKLIKGYTEKQWGRKCIELPAFIIKRLPLRFTFDNNYFTDKYQGIPIGGYNKLIDGLLKGVETKINTNFRDLRGSWQDIADKLVYTGPLDEYFDYKFGRMEWRSLRFEEEIIDSPNYQGNAVMNFTDAEVPYTRVYEHKHFELFGDEVYQIPKTVISKEYPAKYEQGLEPYYTINDDHNNALSEQYKEFALQEKNVIFGGRLAEYKYYDMDQVIEKAMGVNIV